MVNRKGEEKWEVEEAAEEEIHSFAGDPHLLFPEHDKKKAVSSFLVQTKAKTRVAFAVTLSTIRIAFSKLFL